MRLKLTTLLCGLLYLTSKSHQANILLVGTLVSHSHHFWNEAIAIGLVDRGHNVTMLSHDETKIERENFTVITLKGIYEKMGIYSADKMDQYTLTPFNLFSFVGAFLDFGTTICSEDIKHETLHKVLLAYPKDYKFDLILWDHTAGDCLYPLIERFGNPPLIGLSPYGISNVIEDIYGGHVYPYVGQVVMPFVEGHHLWQRLWNALYINYYNYKRNTSYKRENVDVSRSVFPDWSVEKFEGVEKRFAVCLVNWNVALNQAQALSPNIIPIGGVQINPGKTLPKDLEDIYKKSKDGVIYFSLGSNIKSETLSAEILNAMGQCFADLPEYEVIWKITVPEGVKLPANVHTVKWAPQTAILSQPKTRLFVSHGGGLSLQETTAFGVPILGIPIFLDQSNNIEKLRSKGGGEMLTIGEMRQQAGRKEVKELFCSRIKKVLLNDDYSKVMKRLSSVYRDVQVRPLEAAVYWVEYVLRHGGSVDYLSPMSRHFNFVQNSNADIALTVISVLLVAVCMFWGLLTSLRKCFEKSRKQKTN